MNWTLIMLNNRLYKIKNTYKIGFLCLKLIKSSLITIRFCALLLEHEYKRVIFKGRKFWLSTMLKVDLDNNQSCPSWHGFKLQWVLPCFVLFFFFYQSSLWWYTCRNQHVSNSKLRRIQLLTYSRQKAKPVKNTWYNHFLQ